MMDEQPSEAAKRKACELANAQGCRWSPYEPTPQLYALALHLDEVDRVARKLGDRLHLLETELSDALRSLMLPDPVDPLEEVINAAFPATVTTSEVAKIRAELDKRGLTIAPKENPDG